MLDSATSDAPVRGLTVVVTRERDDAQPWAQALAERGYQVLQVPLLALDDVPASELSLQPADWCTVQALMFVSARAARVLGRPELALGEALRQAWAQERGPRVWAPGPGTAAALRALGVPEARIDSPRPDAAQFDSDHLWDAVRDQVHPGHRTIIVRGEGAEQAGAGRDALRQCLQAAGGHVGEAVVYRRSMPQWREPERSAWVAALADPACVWLISSSVALRHGHALGGGAAWPKSARVLVTHPRMAQTARELGCVQVHECRPTLAAVTVALGTLSAKI